MKRPQDEKHSLPGPFHIVYRTFSWSNGHRPRLRLITVKDFPNAGELCGRCTFCSRPRGHAVAWCLALEKPVSLVRLQHCAWFFRGWPEEKYLRGEARVSWCEEGRSVDV